MIRFLSVVSLLLPALVFGQPSTPSTANAHSHNDYEQKKPFESAWTARFGSMEADVFLHNGNLYVAHNVADIKPERSLATLYLNPLRNAVKTNSGYIYNDSTRTLQLLIDLKTTADSTLPAIISLLKDYPDLTSNRSIRFVITGNQPAASTWGGFPAWLYFDGDLLAKYNDSQLSRIGLFSGNFARWSKWNGKGRMPEAERSVIHNLVDTVHKLGKKIRFWNAPDILNSWYAFLDEGVDFINTDHIAEITAFFTQMPDRSFTNQNFYDLYKPLYKNDGSTKKIRNIILIIGDGTSLPQWYAGYTANGAKLNVFNMHYTGLSKTSSYDNYITDSAPGATSISSGVKTNNRAIGVDHTGQKLELLPMIIRKRNMKTGVITSGDLRDATPASFYGHRPERSDYRGMIVDLLAEPIDLIMGDCKFAVNDSLATRVREEFAFYTSPDQVVNNGKRVFVADTMAARHMTEGRGDWASRAFDKSISILSSNKDGFLLMLEGAQVDHGGHANKLPWAVSEVLDLDRVIGKAMKFADQDGETLVIVTADHETGGLTLTGGDYSKGRVFGQFSTGDHTALPVPVFAYGPGSALFTGVYENTEIFYKILKALNIDVKRK